LLPTCDHIWATDHRWWSHHRQAVQSEYKGQCWTQDVQWPANESPQAWNINCLTADTQATGLSKDKTKVHTGKNSGFAAVGLAYNLGADRIILLGYDMMMDGDRRHWFGNHPDKLNVASNYNDFARMFGTINPAEYGIEIWNVSRVTALKNFPIYNLDDL